MAGKNDKNVKGIPEERKRFISIDWLMPSIDVRNALERLGVKVDKQIGDEIWGYCPDHKLFTFRDPSHPKWSVNIKTGQTKCLTEDRGSNLLFIVSRLQKCSPKDAAEWLLGGAALTDANIRSMESDMDRWKVKQKDIKTVKNLTDMAELLKTGSMTPEGYEFFMRPPGKKPTFIEKATVDHFGCVMCRNGYFSNRTIVPCKMHGTLVGFVAIDILGEMEWARRHPTLDPKDKYRKVLFPHGMERGKILFGFDECKHGEEIIFIVEGAREVMKLWQMGYRAVAVQGSCISDQQVRLLATMSPKKIVILMDGDPAGYDAQRKVYDKLAEFFQFVKKGNPPLGHDPKTLHEDFFKKFIGCG
jgi:hypothetical protein